ncbi:MAG: RIP metalloprotease RseP [Betaproteobacteria bacterium]|nr:RIP metalloprotease RseP [Betaproteobacteria bacterium]
MSLLFKIAAFIVALGVLIVVHELGHYWVARWCNVRVLRFSLGFGSPLRTWIRGKDKTEWSIAAFPLGGYVKMLDEREGPVLPSELHRAFNTQSVGRRIAIVSAGPIANFLLAIALYWVMFLHGVPGIKPIIAPPAPNTPAAAAGFAGGETITRIGQREVKTFQDMRWLLLDTAVARESVRIETHNPRNEINFRNLDLSSLRPEDLDGDFLEKAGLGRYEPESPAIVGVVVEGRVAAQAGVQTRDKIVAIDGNPVGSWRDLVAMVSASPGKEIVLGIDRAGHRLSLAVIPEVSEENGKKVGRIGIGHQADPAAYEALMTEVRHGPWEALTQAVGRTWDTSAITLKMLGKMVVGDVSLKNLSGPITIADYAGQSAQMGWLPYLTFIALISISLGVLNLLPVPLLDGGHLLYYAIEILKGSPLSERAMELGQRAGMALLFVLMACALYNDIYRLAGGS